MHKNFCLLSGAHKKIISSRFTGVDFYIDCVRYATLDGADFIHKKKKLDIQIFNEVNTIISANFPLNLFCASRRPVHSNPAVVASLSAVPVRRISCNIVRYSCMLSSRSVCLSVNYTKRFFHFSSVAHTAPKKPKKFTEAPHSDSKAAHRKREKLICIFVEMAFKDSHVYIISSPRPPEMLIVWLRVTRI